MHLLCCYRRWLAAAGCFLGWLIAVAAAAGQSNLAGGVQFSLPTPGDGAFPAAPLLEPLPPALADPIPDGPYQTPPSVHWFAPPPGVADFSYHLGGKARGYYINDQRIEFSGMESTFAVEGVIEGGAHQRVGDWELLVESQLFLNQPFDRNILMDTPTRQSFAANFDIPALEISQLYLGARNGDLYAAIGRFVTPFGRFYFPNYRNNFDDSPFIRSEAIPFRETGFFLQWDPDIWVITAAVTNGGLEQDTNSSKAVVARVGIDQEWYALGTSVKWQDGIGSDAQKAFNNHVGLDAMIRRGAWTLSAEAIYDQYGLRRPGTSLDDIFWGRSLYFRDLNNGLLNPITGVGYYVNLGYEGPLWSLMLNYGEFYPERIGVPEHDVTSRRGIVKASRHWTRNFETYGVVMIENDLPDAFDGNPRRGIYLIFGSQFSL
jgi:hypothetical protein